MILIEGKNKHLAKRFTANVIDYALVLALMALIIFSLGEQADGGAYVLRGSKALLIPLVWFLYFPVCEAIVRQTPGKKAFGLYVVDQKGEASSIGQAFLRRLLDPMELMFFGIPSLLSINHSATNQRIGDMMAGTFVVSADGRCQYCRAELELDTRELTRGTFTCPLCNNINNLNQQ